MRQKKMEHIQKLETAKSLISHEIENRERQMADDKLQDDRLVRLKTEYTKEQERLADLVREEARRKSNMQAEIELRQRQIE